MTYGLYENLLIKKLQQLYDKGEAFTITDWILEEITGYNRHSRRQIINKEIEAGKLAHLKNAEKQLLKHKPVQYVLGYTYFCGMKFLVDESVLIPRPETEELVEWTSLHYRNRNEQLQILEIGTGSGCISVSIKKRLPLAIINAVDISNEAIILSKKNAALNGQEIQFQRLDFLDETNWLQLDKYDIIVSNPPYIPSREKASLDKNIIHWEPDIALFVPDENPLLFYKKIVSFGKAHLLNGGAIFMETHQAYANAVQELFTTNGYTAIVKKDMYGNDRMVRAVNP